MGCLVGEVKSKGGGIVGRCGGFGKVVRFWEGWGFEFPLLPKFWPGGMVGNCVRSVWW